MAFLTTPSEQYRESYIAALREFQAEGRNLDVSPEEREANFSKFIQGLLDQTDSITWTKNWVI